MFDVKTGKPGFLLLPSMFLIDVTKLRGQPSCIYKSCNWEYVFPFVDSIGGKEREITLRK